MRSLTNSRILLGALALGAFIVTLAFSSWHEDLWQSAADSTGSAAPQSRKDGVVPPGPVVSVDSDLPPKAMTSMPPDAAAPAAAMTPTAAMAPLEASQGESQYEQNANPGVDGEAMRRDRGVQHSSAPH